MRRSLPVLCLAASLLAAGASRAADEFLEPDIAFKLSAQSPAAQRVELRFDVASGYYLYTEKFKVDVVPASIKVGALEVPKGKVKYDETFQKDVETHRDRVVLTLPLAEPPAEPFKLLVTSQGCADKGLCYPPTERAFRVDPQPSGGLRFALLSEAQAQAWKPGASAALGASPSVLPPVAVPAAGGTDAFADVLRARSAWGVIAAFAVAGLLLSFTPCVLPMVPILSSIIVGGSATPTRGRGFRLALAYSLGMALVYTLVGMAAGLAGEGLAAALQNVWVLGAFAVLLAVLALSMFGAYELQMPASVQSRFTQWSAHLQGGRYAGVFAMGGLSAVIVGPCVAAPLAGALIYISQSRDALLGGAALFSMAMGMSLPLLLLGASAGALLPKAGAWMDHVKHWFGFMLLGVALWMLAPVIPNWLTMLMLGALLLACAVYLGAFESIKHAVTPRRAMTKGLGLALSLMAALQFVGAASGGREVLQPVAHFAAASSLNATLGRTARLDLPFQAVKNLDALDTALKTSNQVTMLDLYADWCVSCKEMEAFTFTDEPVRRRLAQMTLLRADVTANSADDKALMRRYGLFGPPALLFFEPGGSEVASARVIGYQDAKTFLEHLNRIDPAGAIKLSQK